MDDHERKPTRKKPSLTSLKSPIVNIEVGPTKVTFNVHEALLKQYSTFFAAALDGGFEEARTRSFQLDDEDPIIFEVFVGWLYYQKLRVEDKVTLEPRHVNQQEAIQLWILGDKRGVPILQNDALSSWWDGIVRTKQFNPVEAKLVYENTTERSILRWLYVTMTAIFSPLDAFDFDLMDDYPKEFLMGVVRQQCHIHRKSSERRKTHYLTTLDISKYYVKVDGGKSPTSSQQVQSDDVAKRITRASAKRQ